MVLRMMFACFVACGAALNVSWGSNAQTPGAPASPTATLCTKAGQFCVNRETSSWSCKVQEATEFQMFGPNLTGPFKTRKEATDEMCRRYAPASTDPNTCGNVLPTGVCDKKRPQ